MGSVLYTDMKFLLLVLPFFFMIPGANFFLVLRFEQESHIAHGRVPFIFPSSLSLRVSPQTRVSHQIRIEVEIPSVRVHQELQWLFQIIRKE